MVIINIMDLPTRLTIMTGEKHNVGMFIRVLGLYAAWLMMVWGLLSAFISILVVIAAPMFAGSVVWHLRKTYYLSAVNRLAFCGAIAFFPFLVIQIFASKYL